MMNAGRARRAHWVVLPLALITTVATVLPASAQSPEPKASYSLKDLIQRTLATSPEIRQMERGAEAAMAKKDQADAGRLPQIEVTGVVGPSSRARGTVEGGSPDRKDKPTVNNVFERVEMQLVQPLYTFGKLTGFREAAEQGVKVEKAKVDEKAADLILKVKELYYGRLLASDMLGLIDEINEDLDKAIEKTERQLKAEVPGADEMDLYKLKAFRGEVLKNREEAQKGFDLATGGLMFYAGLDRTKPFELDTIGLEVTPKEVAPVDRGMDMALELRPEMTQVRAGLKATESLVKAEESNLYPQFFVALNGVYAQAGNRTRQQNPFAYDPLNDRYAVVVLGFKYNLDFGITRGKIRVAQAEHLKVGDMKLFAEQGVPLQVRKAHRELTEAQEALKATEDGWRNAKKWLVAAKANYDLGVGESRELGQAAETYARLRADNFKAMYNYNLALANIEHATGQAVKEEAK
ncbi:MAG: TolC family protein [candidate division NC10 bacterium]|nr:TolC family protein [candidate division NC10 bacterium]MDE2322671.1 TolC family protein [candidate division NC10 bacterium]